MPGPRQSRMVILHPEADLRGLHAPRTQGASDFLTNRGGAPSVVWAANHGTLPHTALTSETASHAGQAPVKNHGPLLPAPLSFHQPPFSSSTSITRGLLCNKGLQMPGIYKEGTWHGKTIEAFVLSP